MVNTKNRIAVLSFYCFTEIDDIQSTQQKILFEAKRKYINGTIILAKEGFNGSVSGLEDNLNFLLKKIQEFTSAKDINAKINFCDQHPFSKIKVKLKDEIVALKAGGLDIKNLKGEYIESKDWDKFVSQKNVVMIDTRNDYEIGVGTFVGSINPNTESFSEFPEWIKNNIDKLTNKKIAMFCTGGIRCEKSTALLKKLGLKDVYHLKGGILQYLEESKNTSKLWNGECFVFDDRGAVSDTLTPSNGFWVQKGQTAKGVSQSKTIK